jgi:hypothetical protein
LKINGGAEGSSRLRSRVAQRLAIVPSLWVAEEERDDTQVLRWRRTGGAWLSGGGGAVALSAMEEEQRGMRANEGGAATQ